MQPNNTSLEEANNQVVLHIRDTMLLRDNHKFSVRTVDFDVIVIFFFFFFSSFFPFF